MKKAVILWGIIVMFIPLYGQEEGSGVKINPYGFIKLEAIYDNSEIAEGDWQLFARPGGSEYDDQTVFTMNVRHSRIGLNIEGPKLGRETRVHGKIEADFAGGFPNSSTAARQPQLRLRHAWVELAGPVWEFRFGQDWALISGPFPKTASFVVGAGKGNLWMRYPQVRATVKHEKLKLAVSVNRPMAGNTKYHDFDGGDFDPVGDGERSGLPWGMARFWISSAGFSLSASGHYGSELIDDLSGSAHTLNTYSLNGDIQFKTGPVSLTVRVFTGKNLNSFFGGVFQGFTRDSVSVSNIASRGGWAQSVFQLAPNLSVTLGGGMDDPDDDDLVPGMRGKNRWLFGNLALSPIKSLTFMLEGSYLRTDYIDDRSGENLRMMFVTLWNF